jgi:hypothetical protein
MVSDKNNMHGDVDTWMFFKWIFKTACAVLIVTNTWNIVMGVFDVVRACVNSAPASSPADASIDISTVVVDMEERLWKWIGPLFGLVVPVPVRRHYHVGADHLHFHHHLRAYD